MSSPRKLRILCLHGYRQNDQFFREKTGGLRKLFKKYADFYFVNAPHVPSVKSEDRGEVRGWWFSKADDHFSSRDVTNIATGFEDSVKTVLSYIEENGPFDGIFGFSQGACMTHLLLAKHQLNEIDLPVNFAILASGFLSLSSQHAKYNDVVIETPSLHIFGTGDEIVLTPVSEKLAANFAHPSTIIHDGGHFVPPMSKYKQQFSEFLDHHYQCVNAA